MWQGGKWNVTHAIAILYGWMIPVQLMINWENIEFLKLGILGMAGAMDLGMELKTMAEATSCIRIWSWRIISFSTDYFVLKWLIPHIA